MGESKHVIHCLASQPARAVWIEIRTAPFVTKIAICHSLRGLCGLKSEKDRDKDELLGHSLRGLCGLKLLRFPGSHTQAVVTACEGCVD